MSIVNSAAPAAESKRLAENLEYLSRFVDEHVKTKGTKDKKTKQFIDKTGNLLNKINTSKDKSRAKFRRLVDLVGVLLLLTAIVLLNWEHIRIYFVYFIRILVVFASNFIDISSYYHSHCLVSNPYVKSEGAQFDVKLCKPICGRKNQRELFKKYDQHNLTEELFYNKVVGSNLAIIETSEIKTWPIVDYHIKSIAQLYTENEDILNEDNICFFDSSLDEDSIASIFRLIAEGDDSLKSYSVMWENCNKLSPKIIKKLIKRPTFLSTNFELVTQNWLFGFKNKTSDFFLSMPVTTRINILCQISGDVKVKLIPRKECEKDCKIQRIVLKKHQMLVYSDIWSLEFKPSSSASQEEIISLGLFAY